jgi:hypothetical protein
MKRQRYEIDATEATDSATPETSVLSEVEPLSPMHFSSATKAEDLDINTYALSAIPTGDLKAPIAADGCLPNPSGNEDQRIREIKRQWIVKQRPPDRSLCCSDYSAAEAASKAGLPGKREYGGSHLCIDCRGLEYRDDPEDGENVWEDIKACDAEV